MDKKLDSKSVRLFYEKLKGKGVPPDIIHKKLSSVDKFARWASNKGYISKKNYEQICEAIADIFQKLKSEYQQAGVEKLFEPSGKPQVFVPKITDFSSVKYSGEKKTDGIAGELHVRFNLQTYKIRSWLNGVLKKLPFSTSKGKKTESSRPVFDRSVPANLGPQHFIGFVVVLILVAAMGAGIYNRFFAAPEKPLAYPTNLTRAGRILSFQGRLTDSLGNPITTATNITFKLYNASTGGNTLYGTGACPVTPDHDGIFDVLIGGSGYSPTPPQTVCGTEITSNVFSENANVYLGVTVGSDSEMAPRQQIANVGYAINAETLQGLPPGSSTSNIPYINKDGNLLIATSNPGIKSTYESASFTIASAKHISLQSAAAGDINLTATGSGSINARTYTTTSLFNVLGGNLKVGDGTPSTTLNGEDAYIEGTFEVDGASRFDGSVVVSGLSSGVVINSSGTLSSESTLAVARGGTAISSYTSGDILYASGSTTLSKLGIGSSGECLTVSSGAPDWATCGGAWSTTSGVVHLTTSTDNVTIGSSSNLAKLGVDGDTDEIQLLVQGNGTQTSNLVVFENSAGTDLFTLDNSGNGAFTGDLAITGGNITTAVTADSTLTVTGTFTANGALNANGSFTLGDNGDTGSINTSDWDISTTGDLTGIGAITADGTITFSSLSSGVLINSSGVLSSEAQLAVSRGGTGIGSYTAGDVLYASAATTLSKLGIGSTGECLTVSGGIPDWGSCAGSGSGVTLQAAYDNGSSITTSDARDIDITLADTTTDSNLDIDIVADNTVSISRLDGASTEAPSQLLLVENLDTDLTIADGLLFNVATGGVITDAIDASDPEIVNALNVGANTILGTTGDIDFTNFDVTGSSGNVTTAGDIAVNGGDITTTAGTASLFNTNATSVNIAGAATSVGIGASSGTLTINNATISAPNATTFNCSDCINFDDLADSLSLDAATTIALGANAFNINLDSTGDFVIQDGGTAFVTFADDGSTTFANDIALNGGDLTTTSTTATLFNATATTLNIGGAATTLSLGASTGTTTVNNNLTVTGDVAVNGDDITSDSNLTINATGYVRIGSTGTPDNATGDNDLYVQGKLEADGVIYGDAGIFSGDITVSDPTPSLFLTDTTASAEDFSVNVDGDSLTIRNDTDARNDLTISGTGAFTINGASVGEGTSVLTLSSGDLVLTDGDLTLSSGEISATSDDATGTNFLFTPGTLTTGVGVGIPITSNAITSGGGISSSLTSSAATASFTGDIGSLSSSRTNSTAAQTLTDTGNILDLSRTTITNNGTATTNVTGPILNVTNTATQTLGTLSDSAALVKVTQDADATGALLHLVSNRSSTGTSLLIEQTDGGTDALLLQDNGNLTIGGDLAITGGNITTAVTADSTLTVTGTFTANGALNANGSFTLGDNGDTGSINTSDWDISTTGDLTGIGAITADGAISFTPSGTNDITFTTDADSFLIVSGLTNGTGTSLCVDGSSNVIKCSVGSSTATLQSAYDNTGGNSITTTDNKDIDFILDDTTTDSNFDIDIVADNTVSISRTDNASTESPTQLLLVENLDTDLTVANGILFNVATGGVMTDAIDASDAEIVNAINVGANTILGTTGDIDFTNFDVTGSSGNVTTAGDIAVNGGDITTSQTTFNLINATATTLNIGGAATTLSLGASTGTTTVNNALTVTGTLTTSAATDITTGTNQDLTLLANGTGEIVLNDTVQIPTLGSAGSTSLCRNASNQLSTCDGSNPDNVTLQLAYGAGNTISTSDARDIAFTLADTTTDSNFTITTATSSTGQTRFILADGTGTTPPNELVLIDAQDTNLTLANALTIQGSSVITDAIDVSDAEIVNAINVGANTILGTTGDIDFTNFDVTGSSGNVTTAGDIAVNGGDITTSQTTFNLINATATTLNIGGAATTLSLGASTGTTTVNNALTVTGTLTANGVLNANGSFTLGDNGDTGSINTSDWDISTTGDLSGIGTIALDGDITMTQATPSILLVDSTASSDDYSINVDGSSFTIVNDTDTRTDLTISGTGAFTINGASVGEGTSVLTLSSGDLVLTDGDFTLSSGEISATSDDATGTNFSFTTGALTTGTGLGVASTSNAYTTGSIFSSSLTQSAATGTSVSGDIASISFSPTYSTAITTPAISGNVLDLSRTTTTNSSFASTLTVTGPILNITNSATQTTGTLTDSSSLVKVTQDTDATGALLHLVSNRSSTGTSLLIEQTDGGTDALLLQDNGNLTIGGDLAITGGNVTTATTFDSDLTVSGTLNVNGGTLATDDTTFNLINTTATSVNFAGAATSISIGASTGTLTIGNQTISATNATTFNCSDCINFDDLADSLSVDAATTIALGANAFNINLDSTGDFVIQDGGTAFVTFADDGSTTFANDIAVNGGDITSTGNLTLNATGYVRIGDTATPGSATGDDDLFVESDLEVDGTIYADGGITASDFTCTDCLDFTDFEDTLDLDAALTLNQTTNTWTQSFTGTTTTGFSYTGSGLTTGNLFDLANTSTAATSSDLIQGDHTATYTTAQTVSGNLLDLSRALTINAAATTLTVSGAVATISDNCTVTAGTCTNSANVLFVDQNYSSSSGNVLAIENAGTGSGIALSSSSTGVLATLDSTGAVTTADGLLIRATHASGVITDAIDVSDAEIVNALNVGANTITGTTAVIDFTSFDVDGSGVVTTAGNINANGGLDVDDAFVVADGGVLTTSQTANFDGAADFDGDVSIADTDIAFDGASTTFTTTGAFTLTPGGAVLLGDGGDTMQINSSDWDISTTGALTGISGITTDGGYTQSGSSTNTFTGVSTFSANVNLDGGFDVDDVFVVADGGAVTANTDVDLVFTGTENLALTSSPTANAGVTTDSLQITLTTPAHSAAGTNIHNALDLDATIGNATAGTNTANIVNIGAITGDAEVTLNALQIGALTGTAATEYAINVGAGWDSVLRVNGTEVINGSGQVTAGQISGTLLNTAADSGTGTLVQNDTLTINGGTNGIDTSLSGDTYTLNLDTTEIGTTTFGSGSGITWTFDAGATDPTIAFGSDSITLSTGTVTGTLTANGALNANGSFTLGDNGDTGSINTSDWDISTTGALTGVSGITTDGGYTQSGSSTNTFTGVSTFSANVNLDGGFDVDDVFVVADGGAVTANTDVDAVFAGAENFTITNTTWNSASDIQSIAGTLTGDVSGDILQLALTNNNASASTGTNYILNLINNDNSTNTSVIDALALFSNDQATETLADGVIIRHNASSGTLTDALQIENTTAGGTITNAINIVETAGTITNGLVLSSAFSVGIDAGSNTIVNIGNAGTDFDSSGGLTLASTLTLSNNTLTCTACIDITDIGANAVDDSELVDTLSYTGALTLTQNLNANGGLDVDDAFVVADGGVLTTSQTANFDGAADFDGDVSIADTDIAFDGASTTFTTTGAFTLTPGGAVLLGDGGDTMQINSSDWDISTTGALTGISGITTDGGYTQSGSSANTLTGATTFDGLATFNTDVDMTFAGSENLLVSNTTFNSASNTVSISTTQTGDVAGGALRVAYTNNTSASTALNYIFHLSNADNGANTGVVDALALFSNDQATETLADGVIIRHNASSGTLTDALQIENTTAGGTITNAINIVETAGTITNGINIGSGVGTAIVLQNSETIDNSTNGQIKLAGNTGAFTLALGTGDGGTPTATTIRGPAASGTDVAGGNLTVDASTGTGSGGSGYIAFRTAPANAGTAISQNSTSTGNTGSSSSSSLTFSHTVNSGSNKILVVGVAHQSNNQTVSSVAFNTSESLTKLDAASNGANADAELWYLVNPTVTTANVVVTMTGSSVTSAGAVTYNGVHQTTPWGTAAKATGTSQTATVDVTSATGELVVDIVAKKDSTETISVGGGQTERYNVVTSMATAAQNIRAGGSEEAGASSVTMSWTWTTTNREWAIVGAPLKQASPAGGSDPNTLAERMRIDKDGNVSVLNGAFCVDNDDTTCPSSPTAGRLYAINATVLTDDIAELMRSREQLEPGDVVVTDEQLLAADNEYDQNRRAQDDLHLETFGVKKSTKPYQTSLVGVVSTKPGITLGGYTKTENDYDITLAGRIPVKIAPDSKDIKAGDFLTSSAIAGRAMKADKAGVVIGKALEDWTPDSGKDKVMTLLNLSYNDPTVSLASAEDLEIEQASESAEFVYTGSVEQDRNGLLALIYNLQDSAGNILANSGAFAKVITASIKTGVIETKNAVVHGTLVATNATFEQISAIEASIQSLTVSKKITSPVVETENLVATGTAELNEIATNVIKPQEENVTVDLTPKSAYSGKLSKLIVKGLEDKEVATIDSEGNATFSGTLAARDATVSGTLASNALQSNTASVAGKLTAKEIESETISQLRDRLTSVALNSESLNSNLSSSQNQINEIQTLLAELQNSSLPTTDSYQNLDSSSAVASTDSFSSLYANNLAFTQGAGENLTLTGNLNVENAYVSNTLAVGNIFISDDTILTSAWELKLGAVNGINLMDGAVTIARDGTITTKGTLIAQGGVRTNEIKPISDGGTININGAEFDASGSAKLRGLSLDKYLEATDEAVIIAAADNLIKNGLEQNAIETQTESAGVGLIPSGTKEIIIYNSSVKKDSLVYVTQTTDKNIALNVTGKETCQNKPSDCKPYFKVTAGTTSLTDTKFNWLIIN